MHLRTTAPFIVFIFGFCPASAHAQFIRGDANVDSVINISDAVYVFMHLFKGAPPPVDIDALDSNDDGRLDISDMDYLSNYLFIGGAPPPPPFPDPGLDPTPGVVVAPQASSVLSLFSPEGINISKPAGTTFQIPIEVRLDVDAVKAPIDAFSVGVQTSDGTFLTPEVGVNTASGAEFTETAATGSVAIAAVLISFTASVPALGPGDNPHTLLHLTLEGTAPALGNTAAWNLTFQDGLTGSGQPVQNIVSVAGTPFVPEFNHVTINITAVPEPATILLAMLGMTCVCCWRRRR